MAEGWITIEQAAEHLSVSPNFLYNKGKILNIPRVKLGKMYRYKVSQLDNWVLSQSENQPSNA